MDFGLSGAACIVTGGGGAIGRATARMLASQDARVLIVGPRQGTLEATSADCGERGETFACDITAPGAASLIADRCIEQFGRIDVFVNCAGSTRFKPLPDLDETDLEQQWEINVLALFRLLRVIVAHMAERGSGRVVSVASVSGRQASEANLAYGVTKSAQIALVRGYAEGFAGRGVIMNSVLPGPVDTAMWREVNERAAVAKGLTFEAVASGIAAGLPRRRVGSADEIASVITFLASPLAANVVGSAWTVDGGAARQIF